MVGTFKWLGLAIDYPHGHHMTCLTLTTRLSVLKRTHYWIRDKEKVDYLGLKKKFHLRRTPSSGISLSGGQVSDGRLCRGLIVATENIPMTCFTLTSRASDLERTQFWVRDNEKIVFNYDICVNNTTIANLLVF